MSINDSSFLMDDEKQETPPLTAEQARIWRLKNRVISPWFVFLCQLLVGIVVAAALWYFRGINAGVCLLYGLLAVALPALPFGLAVLRQTNLTVLMVWEFVKLLISVMLLVLSVIVFKKVDWSALLVGVIIAVGMYWMAPFLKTRSSKNAV